MAVPDFQSFMLPLLKLARDGEEHRLSDAIDALADQFQLSQADRSELLPSGKQARLNNRIGWAVTYLRKAGLLRTIRRGTFLLTDRGRELLESSPSSVDVDLLRSRYPDFSDFAGGSEGEEAPATFTPDVGWSLRSAVQERVREKIEHSIPEVATRTSAMKFFAFAIENADEERSDAWYVRETSSGLRLTAGRLLACEIRRGYMRVSVIGPLSDDLRTRLGADPEDDEEFAKVPGGVLLTFPPERLGSDVAEIEAGFNAFVDQAMARVRTLVALDDHTPEAVAYVESVVGRDLPQPEPLVEADDEAEAEDDGDDPALSREPQIRGRAQVFERGERTIGSLMEEISRETIALPDLQRPFVWPDTKVRDLLDSLFLGYPVGTLVLWHTSTVKEARALGAQKPGLRASTLVIDGQQRLTSLAAVMTAREVIGKDRTARKIAIAFRPRDGRFEVPDAAIRRDPEFLSDLTELWTGARQNSQIRRELISTLRDQGRVVDDAYEDAVERNLEIARNLPNYRFPTIEVRESGNDASSDERMSEIFVRINNQGSRLGQADFVLTLLSVFHGELRDRLEARAREMSQDGPVAIDTQQLLRAACGVAFDRARMSAVYRYLRGIDPNTGEADPAARSRMIDRLDEAARACVEPTPWRDYLLRIKHAGFVNSNLIASKNAIVNGYALYIRGQKAGVPRAKLDELVARWVFGSLLTGRYSSASESAFEQDLARVSSIGADAFVRALDEALSQTLSGDYWTNALPAGLETQKPRSNVALSFRAAQIVLGARALFSDLKMRELLDPPPGGTRAAGELHHLFPVAWLATQRVDRRRQNQVANLADVGWYENSAIGAQSPARYVPRVRERLELEDDNRWGRMCAEHALPLGWETMGYEEFLHARRNRMADIIRVAYRKLGGDAETPAATPPWFLPGAEVVWRDIVAVERALRGLVRDVYSSRFAEAAAARIEQALPDSAREPLARALRSRPAGAEPLSIVDYLYLGQLPPLLFSGDVWQLAQERLGSARDLKQRLQVAIGVITPVRNEIAHVREIDPDRLLRAKVACNEILSLFDVEARR